jgi:hypothetical protein
MTSCLGLSLRGLFVRINVFLLARGLINAAKTLVLLQTTAAQLAQEQINAVTALVNWKNAAVVMIHAAAMTIHAAVVIVSEVVLMAILIWSHLITCGMIAKEKVNLFF